MAKIFSSLFWPIVIPIVCNYNPYPSNPLCPNCNQVIHPFLPDLL